MAGTPQNSQQTILDHGLAVQTHLFWLYDYAIGKIDSLPHHRIPDWFRDNKSFIASKLLPKNILMDYATFHDCGKPLCHTIDSDGKSHFPNHTQVSYDLWMSLGGDEAIGQLILHDMDMHTIKADGIPSFATNPLSASLLLSSLAEIHANAAMFGGIESISFKIKYKQIDKRGNALLNIWKTC